MACCLTAPNHYPDQCWSNFSQVQWHSSEGNFKIDTSAINYKNCLENYQKFHSIHPGANELKVNGILSWLCLSQFHSDICALPCPDSLSPVMAKLVWGVAQGDILSQCLLCQGYSRSCDQTGNDMGGWHWLWLSLHDRRQADWGRHAQKVWQESYVP